MRRTEKRLGFTLVELMIVVVVLAILAVVAMFSYNRYMRKARTQEAMSVLGDIRIKQAQFMASYGTYVSTGAGGVKDDGGYYPTALVAGEAQDWLNGQKCETASADTPFGKFCLLSVRPTGDVYFQYKTEGWDPSSPQHNSNPPNDTIPLTSWQDRNSPRWWHASARTCWDAQKCGDMTRMVYVLDSVLLTEPIIKEEGATGFIHP